MQEGMVQSTRGQGYGGLKIVLGLRWDAIRMCSTGRHHMSLDQRMQDEAALRRVPLCGGDWADDEGLKEMKASVVRWSRDLRNLADARK